MQNFRPADQIYIDWRKGTDNDPYEQISQSAKIINGFAILQEIPYKFDRVYVDGFYEVHRIEELKGDTYIVNYNNGMITFAENNEGLQVNVSYTGRGIIMYPAHRIFTHDPRNNDILLSLQDIVDIKEDAISTILTLHELKQEVDKAYENSVNATEVADQANADAQIATQNANESADNADDNAQYAQSRGDYADEQGDYAKSQGDYAKSEGDTAKSKGDVTELQGSEAESKGSYANEQGEFAKTQGEFAQSEANNLSQLKDDVISATSGANNSASNADDKADLAENMAQYAELEADNAKTQAEFAQSQGNYAKTQADMARDKRQELDNYVFNELNLGKFSIKNNPNSNSIDIVYTGD